jgi:Ca-activated chloride channel family protein
MATKEMISMSRPTHIRPALGAAILATATLVAGLSRAQSSLGARSSVLPLPAQSSANYWIVPQCRAFAIQKRAQPVRIAGVQARVQILAHTARTTLLVTLHNPSPRQEEAVLLLPVPAGAAVSEFTFQGPGLSSARKGSTQLLTREDARQKYDAIVRKLEDPALLEFVSHSLVKSSVFPVPAGGVQRLFLTYEQVLDGDAGRVDYVLPRSSSLQQHAPWSIEASIAAKQPISMVYSPSHTLELQRKSPREMSVRLAAEAQREPGSFRLSYLLADQDNVTASLFTYPADDFEGGYFLLMAGLPPFEQKQLHTVRREVTIALDISGSMAGEKMDQARAAALQVVEGLRPDETFNILDYSGRVHRFAERAVPRNRENTLAARRYLEALTPGGGTNIGDALHTALQPEPTAGSLPIVLFLTDGLPTIGTTSELRLREIASKHNPHERRIFTFGVGHDVNVPLLDALADKTRATATYVQPKQDVELAVAKVFRRLYGPVLASPQLSVLDANGNPSTRRVRDLQPLRLPDLFEGDQLVLLGKYLGEDPLRFQLSGEYFGEQRNFAFRFRVDRASRKNSFVPRLWATRQIATLVDQIRQSGAQIASMPQVRGADPFRDSRLRELRDEILRLSAKFGVLSEYTSFLATDGNALGDWQRALAICGSNLHSKAIRTRSGQEAVAQGLNNRMQKSQYKLNWGNASTTPI